MLRNSQCAREGQSTWTCYDVVNCFVVSIVFDGRKVILC